MARRSTLASFSFNSTTLHACGAVLLAAGALGTVIQNDILGAGGLSGEQLLEVLQTAPHGMALAAVALFGQVMEVSAVPLFAFLLAEGAARTGRFGRYLLRVLGLAVLSEVPYRLLTDGAVFIPGRLNPVFGAVIALVMLYFFRTFREKRAAHRAIRLVAVAGAFLWSSFLGAAYGAPLALITAVLWATRGRDNLRLVLGGAVSMACSVFSPLFLLSPFSFLGIHLYNGERGGGRPLVRYLACPAIWTAFCLLGRLAV